jgi:hypothetical protein
MGEQKMSVGQEQMAMFPPVDEKAVRQAVAKELKHIEGQTD